MHPTYVTMTIIRLAERALLVRVCVCVCVYVCEISSGAV